MKKNTIIDARGGAEIIIRNSSFIKSDMIFRNDSKGSFKNMTFENMTFSSGTNNILNFANTKMKFTFINVNEGSELKFDVLDTILSSFYFGDTSKMSIGVFTSSDDISNIPADVTERFENRGVFHIDGDSFVKINKLKIESKDRYAFNLRDNLKFYIDEAEILTTGIWHAGEIRDNAIIDVSKGSIKSKGEMYNTIEAGDNSIALLENVKIDLETEDIDNAAFEGVANAIFVLKNSPFGRAELDDYTVLAYYGEKDGKTIEREKDIDDSMRRMSKKMKKALNIIDIDPDEERVVKVESDSISLMEAAEKYRIVEK